MFEDGVVASQQVTFGLAWDGGVLYAIQADEHGDSIYNGSHRPRGIMRRGWACNRLSLIVLRRRFASGATRLGNHFCTCMMELLLQGRYRASWWRNLGYREQQQEAQQEG
mmetsp:Transcript_35055/g.63094  ORF Transcript_35055/g.63094 Transcript_35055/m.63094 type:complete len:110 (-) Transcript_35055:291-620(-)